MSRAPASATAGALRQRGLAAYAVLCAGALGVLGACRSRPGFVNVSDSRAHGACLTRRAAKDVLDEAREAAKEARARLAKAQTDADDFTIEELSRDLGLADDDEKSRPQPGEWAYRGGPQGKQESPGKRARGAAVEKAARARQSSTPASRTAADGPGNPPAAEVLELVDHFAKDTDPALKRPRRLLFSEEGKALISLLNRLEAVAIFDSETALGILLNAAMGKVTMLGKVDSTLEERLPRRLRSEYRALGETMTPEMLRPFFAGKDERLEKGQLPDWRPLVAAVARASAHVEDLVRFATPWAEIFPDSLMRMTGVSRDELKATVCAFIRVVAEVRPGSWNAAEVKAMQRVVNKTIMLKKVEARMLHVLDEADQVAGKVLSMVMPFGAFAVLLVVCLSVLSGPTGGEATAQFAQTAPMEQLPMLTLNP